MTAGHKHRHVKMRKGSWLYEFLRKPRYYSCDLTQVEKSPYPYGPVFPLLGMKSPVWYLSLTSLLHRWTGFTIEFSDE